MDCFIDRRIHKSIDDSDLKPETKEILKQLDCSVIILAATKGPDKVIALLNNAQPEDTDVKTEDINLGWKKTGDGFDEWTPTSVMKISHTISPNFSTVILGEDDMFTEYTIFEKLQGQAMRNTFLFGLDDSDIPMKDTEEVSALLTDLKFEQGLAFPVSYNTDFNMETDESFSRIFFLWNGVRPSY